MLREIFEQPAVLRALAGHADQYAAAAGEARRRGATTVRLVGHGSSDNAASYAVYAFGLIASWTAFRDSMSLPVYYGSDVSLQGSTVVALSQSGQTPDVVAYVERARERGAYTVAVTNDLGSALAQAAETGLPLAAGDEHAMPATKTYTAEIAGLALLAACAGGQRADYVDGVLDVADRMEGALPSLDRETRSLAQHLSSADRLFAVGRGPEFATARELSLKLLETCRIAAGPLSATDLSHGPVAALDDSFVLWAVATRDPSLPAVHEAVRRAARTGATIVVSGNAAEEFDRVAHVVPVPEAVLPLLAPLLSIVPGQLFARALAEARGLDPDRPSGITKVTEVP
jgi:glucosamine--fructose-6-phosphate aminotransferase (isomerizing)